MTRSLPAPLTADIDQALARWEADGCTRRLWARDAALWSGTDEARWLGWLTTVEEQQLRVEALRALAADVTATGVPFVVLLGMGGSSLGPEVLRQTFGHVKGVPDFRVLDSTDPGQVTAVAGSVDLARTIVIVASKSGSTLEPNILLEYFFDRVKAAVGDTEAGGRFIAITDPGSSLEQLATSRGFRHIVHGVPAIGGRFSALSAFGMVPAAVMGIDVARFLDGAAQMSVGCKGPAASNPGVQLGVTLGVLARHGRNKLTIVASPGIFDLGAWLEQLVAESTGKHGHGIVPVDLEHEGDAGVYGADRVFVYLRLESAPDATQDAAVARLEAAGQPVIRISMADEYALGAEFFRWEIATAVVGALMGINPFDQPDVEASKIATRKLTDAYEASGSLPAEAPIFSDGTLTFFTDERNAGDLQKAVGAGRTAAAFLRAHLNRLTAGDYAALLAYVPMNAETMAELQVSRHLIRDRKRTATCLGFGPRFLHSTGQVYKGGPNTGVFLQVTYDPARDVPVPGLKFTFGVVVAAQARGDFAVLAERGRRALRVHLGPDVMAGLRALRAAIEQALG